MPLSSSASSFFGKLGPQEAGPLTNQGNPAQGIASASQFKTPNLFDTIQAVRQNEIERQAKQAQIAEVLMKLNQAPKENEYRQAQIDKLKYEINSPLAQLIEKGSAAKAAQLLGDRDLYNQLSGSQTQSNTPVYADGDVSQYLAEVDPFTNKPTARAVQANTAMKLKYVEDSARARGKAKFEQEKNNVTAQAKVIGQDLDDVLDTWKTTSKHLTGPIQGRTIGPLARLFQVGGGEKVQEYDDTVEFIMANISRQLGGERGVLTDRDISRIKSAMPLVRDNEQNAQNKISRIKRFIQRRVNQGNSGQLNEFQPNIEDEIANSPDNIDNQVNVMLDQLGAE